MTTGTASPFPGEYIIRKIDLKDDTSLSTGHIEASWEHKWQWQSQPDRFKFILFKGIKKCIVSANLQLKNKWALWRFVSHAFKKKIKTFLNYVHLRFIIYVFLYTFLRTIFLYIISVAPRTASPSPGEYI